MDEKQSKINLFILSYWWDQEILLKKIRAYYRSKLTPKHPPWKMKFVLHATNKGHNDVDPLNIFLNVSSYFLSFHQDRSKAWWLFTVKGVKFYRQTAFLWSDPSPGLSPPPLPFMSAWCMMGDVSPRLLASTYPFLQLRPSLPLMSPSISLTHTDKYCKILKEGPSDPNQICSYPHHCYEVDIAV